MALIIHNTDVPDSGLGDALRTGFNNQNTMNAELYSSVVFKVSGYDLSKNDFTDLLLAKLNALDATANKNVQPDWNELDPTSDAYIKNKPVFSSDEIFVGAEWTGTGLEFDVYADAFPIGGEVYPATPSLVTLDASDATLDRIDLIVAIKPTTPDTVGTVGKITGTPASSSLVVPPNYDPSLYYVIKQITVKAAATTPNGAENTVIFNEGTEWALTLPASAVVNTSSPSTGANCIEATSWGVNDKIVFTSPTTLSTSDLDLLKFDIKLKDLQIKKYIGVTIINGTHRLATRYFTGGSNGFDYQNLSYQTISITKAFLNLNVENFTAIEIVYFANTAGFYFDNFKILKGSGSEVPPATGISDVPNDDILYGRKNGAWEQVPSVNVSDSEIIVKEKSQIVGVTLDSTKVYKIDTNIVLLAGEYIEIPTGGATIDGFGFNVSSLSCSEAGHTMFKSPVAGSGDLVLAQLSVSVSGSGSKVFDIEDSDGTHAVEIEYVNFNGCTDLGIQTGYRQGTWTTVGVYGCSDGLQLSGNWNGYKVSNSNCFSFGAAGTLFKKDTDTLFTNRLFLNLNVDMPTGAKVCDFQSSNFDDNELLQFNSCIAKLNGVIDIDNGELLIPNISANDLKSHWSGNIGLPDTATEELTEDTTVSGAYVVDWLKDTYFLTMTGDTTFTETNLPASTKNTQEIKLYLTGSFTPTFPSDWLTNSVGSYKGTDINEISIKYIKAGVYFVKISNSLTVYPAPILGSLSPVSLLPSSTQALTISGSFFTPEGFVLLNGQTVNTIDFDPNTGNYDLSVTTGATESEFDIIISNGTSVTFNNALVVNLGSVYIPTSLNWINVSGSYDDSESGKIKLSAQNAEGVAKLDPTFWKFQTGGVGCQFKFKWGLSPLESSPSYGGTTKGVKIKRVSDNATLYTLNTYGVNKSTNTWRLGVVDSITPTSNSSFDTATFDAGINRVYAFERNASGLVTLKRNGSVVWTPTHQETGEMYVELTVQEMEIINIQCIDLA